MSARIRNFSAVTVVALVLSVATVIPLFYLGVRSANLEALSIAVEARTLRTVAQTIWLTLIVVLFSTALATILAFLVTRTNLPAKQLFTFALALPLVIPSYVVALALVGANAPGGLMEQLAGIELPFDIYGLDGATICLIIATYPLSYLLLVAGFRSTDPGLEDAARSLGSGHWKTFFTITLPALRPWIAAGALLVALYVLADFGVVAMLKVKTLTYAIFAQYKSAFDRDAAAVLSLILVGIVLAALSIERRIAGKDSTMQVGLGKVHKPLDLGIWRWPAALFCLTVLVLSLVMPLMILGYWAIRSVDVNPPDGLLTATFNSLGIAALGSLVTVAVALPIAASAARRSSKFAQLPNQLAHLGGSLPGVVIGLAFVFVSIRLAPWLYQTLPLLLLAYSVRFLPQALSGTRSALSNLSPSADQAAQTLGRGPLSRFFTVTTPMIVPGLASSAALVFLSIIKELPATLILRPTGFDTLPTQLWAASSLAAYDDASLPALILVLVSIPIVWLLIARRRLE